MATYEEIRGTINSGDLIALTHKEWNSFYDLQVQAVRIFTESEYSHVAVTWVVGGRIFLIESAQPKVRIFPLSNLKDSGFYLIQTPDKPMTERELEYGLKHVGIGQYSKLQAIEGQLNLLNIGDDGLWQCAEYVIAMRRLSGLDLGIKATPGAVVQKALELGYSLQYITNKKE